ncbi:MAG: hypothetical protein NTV98_03890 [Candidatus Roizmanbacteria bacterium]|nr:hypothetical protein [Candidatus Roizmanbacteria bacterium]
MPPKHLFKKYFIPSLLFILGICLGFFFLVYINATYRIQKIEAYGLTPDEQKTMVTLLKGVSTLTIQPSEISKIIQGRFPTIKVTESRIKFPNTLILVIEKEKPIAYLVTDYGYIALAKSGTIVMKERATEIPSPSINFYQTIYHSEYQMGQKIGFTAIERALTFISLLESEGYSVETVAIDSVDMIACKTKGFEVAFSQSRPIELQTHEVRQIIRQIKVGTLKAVRLDLRFDKPVVQLPQK